MTDLAIRDLTDVEIDAVVGGDVPGWVEDLFQEAIQSLLDIPGRIFQTIENIVVTLRTASADAKFLEMRRRTLPDGSVEEYFVLISISISVGS